MVKLPKTTKVYRGSGLARDGINTMHQTNRVV
jgi:hypothetical protein